MRSSGEESTITEKQNAKITLIFSLRGLGPSIQVQYYFGKCKRSLLVQQIIIEHFLAMQRNYVKTLEKMYGA